MLYDYFFHLNIVSLEYQVWSECDCEERGKALPNLVTCHCIVFVSLFGLLTVVVDRLRPFMILVFYVIILLDHMRCH